MKNFTLDTQFCKWSFRSNRQGPKMSGGIYWFWFHLGRSLQRQTPLHRKHKESAHMCVVHHPISQPSLDISPIWTSFHYQSRSQLTTTPTSADYVWKLRFYTDTIGRICLLSDNFHSHSTLILTTIAVKKCMDIGAKPYVCGVFFNVFNADLKSCRLFTVVLGLHILSYVGADIRR
jgi:hypothetical protein